MQHWRRYGEIWAQVVLIICVVALALWGWSNVTENLARRNFGIGFDFLDNQAGFAIGETLVPYSPRDTYFKALWVGLLNTFRVIAFGLVFATVLGITIGIARLSSNWLVKKLALIYVETLRNTPLLLQLFFWYGAFFLALPPISKPLNFGDNIYLSKRGLVIPWILLTDSTFVWTICLLVGLLAATALTRILGRLRVETGQDQGATKLLPIVAIAFPLLVAVAITRQSPLILDLPQWSLDDGVQGGLRLTAEFSTLLIGLTLYTAAFIAEIVRAGITAVPRGQWEAAKGLGLGPMQVMGKIIFPQALHIIVPPLTSQYLNLAKNSSLGIAIGYPDLYAVASPTLNQTGRPIEIIVLLMVTYLVISLSISWIMNAYNRQLQWAQR